MKEASPYMAKTLSLDVRRCGVDAIDAGMSRSGAAKRFGVGRATAIRWYRDWLDAGSIGAQPNGGDFRSGRIEPFVTML